MGLEKAGRTSLSQQRGPSLTIFSTSIRRRQLPRFDGRSNLKRFILDLHSFVDVSTRVGSRSAHIFDSKNMNKVSIVRSLRSCYAPQVDHVFFFFFLPRALASLGAKPTNQVFHFVKVPFSSVSNFSTCNSHPDRGLSKMGDRRR